MKTRKDSGQSEKNNMKKFGGAVKRDNNGGLCAATDTKIDATKSRVGHIIGSKWLNLAENRLH